MVSGTAGTCLTRFFGVKKCLTAVRLTRHGVDVSRATRVRLTALLKRFLEFFLGVSHELF